MARWEHTHGHVTWLTRRWEPSVRMLKECPSLEPSAPTCLLYCWDPCPLIRPHCRASGPASVPLPWLSLGTLSMAPGETLPPIRAGVGPALPPSPEGVASPLEEAFDSRLLLGMPVLSPWPWTATTLPYGGGSCARTSQHLLALPGGTRHRPGVAGPPPGGMVGEHVSASLLQTLLAPSRVDFVFLTV